jgi:hypothetical protein
MPLPFNPREERMNEFTSGEATERQPSSASPPRWKGAHSISLAHQLNEQCIELLCELAIPSPAQVLPPFITLNRDLWCALDVAARARLAEIPFVIVDIRFRDDGWWQSRGGQQLEVSTDSSVSNGIPPKRCEHLLLETLMFAWQVAREDRYVAQIVFAMTPSVARRIAAQTMQQVRTIAAESTSFLRIRWNDDSQFWRELLIAAREANAEALGALRHHAKLLFCGEFLDPRLAVGSVPPK